MVLSALLAGACTTEDEKEYDIPARQEVLQADLETGPDGSPLVFAQVGMNYATAAPLPEWEPRFQMRNVQCIAYAPRAGGWDSHSFRNVQAYPGESYLLRNAKGEAQPMVRDFHRWVLYARNGTEWEARRTFPDGDRAGGNYAYVPGTGNGMLLVGDSAWETLDLSTAGNPPHPRLGIRRSDGTRIILDTISSFYNNLLLAGKGYDFLIVLSGRPQFGDSTQDQEIICYRWSLDARVPDVRKQVLRLDHPAVFGGFLSSQVLGEPRAYIAFGQDSLEEFAVRNDTLSFLGYRVLPASDSGSPLDKSFRNGGLSIDPSGCIHSLDLEGAWTGMRPATDSGSIPVLIHASTCQAAADTVALPHPASGEFQAHASGLRFAPDGSPLLSVVMQKPAIADDGRLQQSIPPSWLYFARRGAGNRWTWEKLAEF